MDEERRHPTAAPGVPAPQPKRPQRKGLTSQPSVLDAVRAVDDPRTPQEIRDQLAKTYGEMLMQPDIQRNFRRILRSQPAKDVVAMLNTVLSMVLPPKDEKGGGSTKFVFNNNTVPRASTIDITATKGSA